MAANNNQIENRLWAAADELRANSKLKSSEYAVPVLGLIFLRYADHRFGAAQKEIEGKSTGRRKIGPADYQAKGVLYLPEEARFSSLLKLPEGSNIGQAINDAMRAVEAENRDLKDVLPKSFNRVDKDRLKDDPRFPYGLPRVDNANYLWIQIFYSALNATGRAGFVMANSASDARGSELEIRKKLIQDQAVDVMVAVGSNFFYTVTLPCTLWFLDRGKKDTERADKVLFVDAREIYQQVDRAHREFTPEQVEFLGNIARLYRGKEPENLHGSAHLMAEKFPDGIYRDVPGLCRVATIIEIEAQGWSLNPGRYVGVADRKEDDFDFYDRLEELNEELEVLNVKARELEMRISENVEMLLERK